MGELMAGNAFSGLTYTAYIPAVTTLQAQITALQAQVTVLSVGQNQLTFVNPINGTDHIISSSLYAYTIDSITQMALSQGTLTFGITINGVAVTGLTNLSISSTPHNFTATANNTVHVGDAVNYVYTNCASTPLNLLAVIQDTRL